MDARRILAEGGTRSIADQSYVGALTQKWGEFLEGMPHRTPAEQYNRGVSAILFENESQYLQNLSEVYLPYAPPGVSEPDRERDCLGAA